jgi:hypothetical protein
MRVDILPIIGRTRSKVVRHTSGCILILVVLRPRRLRAYLAIAVGNGDGTFRTVSYIPVNYGVWPVVGDLNATVSSSWQWLLLAAAIRDRALWR